MGNAEIESARRAFRVDSTMSATDITDAIADLAEVVQEAIDKAYEEAGDDDLSVDAELHLDLLDEIVSELQNITIDADTECPACAGEGVVACDGGGQNSTCPGDETCPACGGETTRECVRCDGSGQTDVPTVSAASVWEAVTAVAEAFSRLR